MRATSRKSVSVNTRFGSEKKTGTLVRTSRTRSYESLKDIEQEVEMRLQKMKMLQQVHRSQTPLERPASKEGCPGQEMCSKKSYRGLFSSILEVNRATKA